MTLREISDKARAELNVAFADRREAEVLLNRLEEDILGHPSYLRVTEPQTPVEEDKAALFLAAVERLCSGEPLQYILGYEMFFGRKFNVSPSVLIPRPETEELCREAISCLKRMSGLPAKNDNQRPLRVLDLCTGSGCIAWTIALEAPGVETVAVDISEDALSVASSQPLLSLQPTIGGKAAFHSDMARSIEKPLVPVFVKADVLAGPRDFAESYSDLCRDGFDLIISNPPYVRESERAVMQRNVLDYEPDIALFVPDNDPLVFYGAISEWAKSLLRPGGACMMEINEALHKETSALFSDFSSVAVLEDMFSKPRMVIAKS